MARQLHYTSAERGLAGHAGFQFVAESPSVTPDVRHVVTPFMSYRPPPHTPPQPDPRQCAELPISLCYQRVGGHALLVRCRYLGQDYSGRYGNFLGHAVLATPEELEGIRPIELWEAAFWSDRPAPELPDVAELGPGSQISPEAVLRHLESLGERGYALLGAVLEALLDCLAGRTGRVILCAARPAELPVWIAALSYSLPFDLAAEVSFITYTADPESAQQRLVGTTPDVVAAITRPGRVFDVDGAAPDSGPLSRFAELAVSAWRSADLAALDALGEVAGAVGGDLALAGTVLAFARGARLRPAEPAVVAEALGRAESGLPDWLWANLAAVLPGAGTELAAAVYRAADPVRRQEIAGQAGRPFSTALVAAEDLAEVVRILCLAADSGIPVSPGDVGAAASGCARTGRGDLLAGYRDCPAVFRRDLLRGFLAGLAVADEPVRRSLLTPALCDWLADADWPAGRELTPAVLASVGRRNPGRRNEMTARLVREPDRAPAELAELVAGMWDREVPSPEQCLELVEAAGTAVAAEPPVLALLGRPLATGRIRDRGTEKLAGAVARLSTKDTQATADAALILELAALHEAASRVADLVAPLLRLDHRLAAASPALAAAVARAAAEELLAFRLDVRMGLLGKLSPELRAGIARRWAELDYRTPAELAELATMVLWLRRDRLGAAALEDSLLRRLRRKSVRQTLEQELRRRDAALLAELGELIDSAEPGKRGVFGLFTRRHED